ncbi:MAG: STAS domain-containing protein [Planctomycetota bacterium]|jgi:anti-anti-sigma regulatory factor
MKPYNGALKFSITGKFAGHAALNCLEFLKQATVRRNTHIILDLRECTSMDSLGIGVIDWIKDQNGQIQVEVLEPFFGLDCSLASVKLTDY